MIQTNNRVAKIESHRLSFEIDKNHNFSKYVLKSLICTYIVPNKLRWILYESIYLFLGNAWQCPFCGQDDFPELTEVWNHFDAGNCPGKAVGVRIRLDNGVAGFIPLKVIFTDLFTFSKIYFIFVFAYFRVFVHASF